MRSVFKDVHLSAHHKLVSHIVMRTQIHIALTTCMRTQIHIALNIVMRTQIHIVMRVVKECGGSVGARGCKSNRSWSLGRGGSDVMAGALLTPARIDAAMWLTCD